MSSIWFDVTTIVHWRRPPVGVVRVEAECFKYFARQNDPRVRFCHFNKLEGIFHEISGEFVKQVLAEVQKASVSAHIPDLATSEATSESRLKDLTKKTIKRLPVRLRSSTFALGKRGAPLVRTALSGVRRGRQLARKVSQRLASWGAPDPEIAGGDAGPQPTVFHSGDVYISIGLDWDQKDLTALYRLKTALGLRVILFCYDLIPVLFPQLCVQEVAATFTRYFVDVAWCADRILCISEASRRDLAALLTSAHAPTPDLPVIRLGSDLTVAPGQAGVVVRPFTSKPYLLFVSTLERRKNHEVIYRALVRMVEAGRAELPEVVFVGMRGWGVNDFLNDLALDPRVKGKIHVLNHVSDAELAELYKGAYFTLYPSLYEGWGLPLAEALAYGKFALASNSSSLPEVGGTLVEYIDPWETNRWAERIAYYLDNPEAVAAREAAIREQFRTHTWEETGRALFQSAVEIGASATLR